MGGQSAARKVRNEWPAQVAELAGAWRHDGGDGDDDVEFSDITRVGIAKSSASAKRRKQLDTFVSLVTVLPFADKSAHAAATIRAKLEKRGEPIGPLDNLIAGTATANNATIVTRNVDEFSRVRGLRVANWYR